MSMLTHYTKRQYLSHGQTVRAFMHYGLSFARYYLACVNVAKQRQSLSDLSARELQDIGITHADALREADRDFWDIPEELIPRQFRTK